MAFTSPLAPTATFVRHAQRPQWGNAMLVWTKDDKRAYQFEDGKLRVFKSKFFVFLVPTEVSTEERNALEAQVPREADRTAGASTPKSKPLSGRTFEVQLQIFNSEYEGGFQGEAWLTRMRGRDVRDRLKRHRDPAVADMQALFAADVDRGEPEVRVQALMKVLDATSLVGKRHVRSLGELEASRRDEYLELLEDFVANGDEFDRTMSRQITVLSTDRAPAWELATIVPALLHPQHHICVHRTTFLAQAAELMPSLRATAVPSAAVYQHMQRLGLVTRDKLVEAGYKPTDLVDVRDFIWTTQRASASVKKE